MREYDEAEAQLLRTSDAVLEDDGEWEDDWVNPVTGHGGDCGCISCHLSQTQ